MEQKIQDLETEKSTLAGELSALKLEHEGCHLKIETLTSQNDTMAQTIESLNEDNEKKDVLIEQLNQVIANAGAKTSTASDGQEITAADGNEYIVRKPTFRLRGDATEYTAKDLVKSADLLKRVLELPGQKIIERKA